MERTDLRNGLARLGGRGNLGVAVSTAVTVAGLLLWLGVGTASIDPDSLAYFNERAGGPGDGFSGLGDSNLLS